MRFPAPAALLALAFASLGAANARADYLDVVIDTFNVPFTITQQGVGSVNQTTTGATTDIVGGVRDARVTVTNAGFGGNGRITVETIGNNAVEYDSTTGVFGSLTLEYDATNGFGTFSGPGLNLSISNPDAELTFDYQTDQSFNMTVSFYDTTNTLVSSRAQTLAATQGNVDTFTIGLNQFSNQPAIFNTQIGRITFEFTSANAGLDFVITSPLLLRNAIPEPGTVALTAMGFAVIGAIGYRKRRKAAVAKSEG